MDLNVLKPEMKFIQKYYFELLMNIIQNNSQNNSQNKYSIIDLFEIDPLTDTIRDKNNKNKNIIENINKWIFMPNASKLTYLDKNVNYNLLSFLLYKKDKCIGACALKINHLTS